MKNIYKLFLIFTIFFLAGCSMKEKDKTSDSENKSNFKNINWKADYNIADENKYQILLNFEEKTSNWKVVNTKNGREVATNYTADYEIKDNKIKFSEFKIGQVAQKSTETFSGVYETKNSFGDTMKLIIDESNQFNLNFSVDSKENEKLFLAEGGYKSFQKVFKKQKIEFDSKKLSTNSFPTDPNFNQFIKNKYENYFYDNSFEIEFGKDSATIFGKNGDKILMDRFFKEASKIDLEKQLSNDISSQFENKEEIKFEAKDDKLSLKVNEELNLEFTKS